MHNPGNHQPARILVADDEASTRKAVVRALELSGYYARGAANGKEVFEKLNAEPFDLLLLDLRMPEMNGTQVMQKIILDRSDLIVIVLTAHATIDSAITAVKTGAVDYLKKPQSMESIKLAIEKALKKATAERQRQWLLSVARQTIEVLEKESPEAGQTIPCEQESIFYLDSERRQLLVRGQHEHLFIALTTDQLAILTLLSKHPGKVLSVQAIAQQALGYQSIDAFEARRIIRPHILRLRRRLESSPYCCGLIQTIRGAGYALACKIELLDENDTNHLII